MTGNRPATSINRRAFLRLAASLPAPLILAACSGAGAPGTALPTASAPAVAADTSVPNTEPAPTLAPANTSLPALSEIAKHPVGTATDVPPTLEALLEPTLAPTPACGDDDDPTPAQTAGPFFTPNSPQRASLLEPGMAGTRLVITGYVLAADCRPLAGALLDFWQADDAGVYDNAGYRLRGHQFTDDTGRYILETILPGLYPGRTRHIHVNVQAANQSILTTQLYFAGEPGNARDGIFRPELIATDEPAVDGRAASFNFVLATG